MVQEVIKIVEYSSQANISSNNKIEKESEARSDRYLTFDLTECFLESERCSCYHYTRVKRKSLEERQHELIDPSKNLPN